MRDNNSEQSNYKMTEFGPLPEGWEVVRLGDLFKLSSGKTRPDSMIDYPTNKTKYPIFGGNGILGWGNQYLVENKCLVIGRVGEYCGNVHIAPEQSWISDNALYTKELLRTDIDLNFLSNNLKHINLNQYRTKSSQPLVSQGNIYQIKIPLPPLPAQLAIAKVLSTVQNAKEKTDAVISATRALKKSLMKHLFTFGPVPLAEAENVPLKETEIGMVPDEWDVVRLGGVVEQRKETINPEDGDCKYVGLEHIDPGESHLKRRGFSNEVRSSKWKFYPSDVLYGKLRPYLDKGVLVDFEGICSTDAIVFKPNNELNEKLLSYPVHMDSFREYATRTMTGVNHPRTSWRALSQFSMPLPSSPSQQRIASILSAVDRKIEAEQTKKKALDDLFKTLLNILMTGKLRVNHAFKAIILKNGVNIYDGYRSGI